MILQVSDLVVTHAARRSRQGSRAGGLPPGRTLRDGRPPPARAVDRVSFGVAEGQALGLVGESGCGKSTLARAVLQLHRPDSGSVRFTGCELTRLSDRQLRPVRRALQMVFQDAHAALSPRLPVRRILAEPLQLHGLWDDDGPRRVDELLELVGLHAADGDRLAHQLSGGQRQRVGIARALALRPRLLVLDEPVSALDVSIQAGIVNLLQDLQRQLGLSYVFIAHDLAVVRHLCDRVAVMRAGRLVETGTREQVFGRPQHPYTRTLLSCAPVPDPAAERARRAARA